MAKSLEEREESRQFRDLRKQLIKTKRENAQLRKRVHTLEGMLIDAEEEALDKEEERFIKKVKTPDRENALTCRVCGSTTVGELELRGTKYYNCLDCGSKGKVN